MPTIRPLLAPHHRQLLTALRDLADGQGGCPGVDELAATVGLTAATVLDQLRELARRGWITPVPGRHAIRVLNPADGSDT